MHRPQVNKFDHLMCAKMHFPSIMKMYSDKKDIDLRFQIQFQTNYTYGLFALHGNRSGTGTGN